MLLCRANCALDFLPSRRADLFSSVQPIPTALPAPMIAHISQTAFGVQAKVEFNSRLLRCGAKRAESRVVSAYKRSAERFPIRRCGSRQTLENVPIQNR